MIDISRAIGEQTAQTYYKEKWTIDDYYTQQNQLQGYWCGAVADHLGLRGAVLDQDFARIMGGRRPDAQYDPRQLEQNWRQEGQRYQLHDRDGKQVAEVSWAEGGWRNDRQPDKLYRTAEAAQNGARHELLGKAIVYRDEKHARRAWDIVSRPGKSVSITAVVGGDRRIIELHREANAHMLDYLQPLIQARGGGNNPDVTTGKFLVARFEHYTSRPEEVLKTTGEKVLAPSALLHTHNVIANMTVTQEGQLRSIDPHEMFVFQRIGKQVYQSYMAHGLRELGYNIEFGKNGSPEIQGYTQEYLDSESLRSKAIQKHLEENGLDGARAASLVAKQNRNEKLDLSPEETMALLRANAAAHGNQAEPIIAAALQRAEGLHIEPITTAHEAVTMAKRSLAEQYAVFEHWDLVTKALEFGQGHVLPPEIERNIASRTQTLEQYGESIPAEFMLALHERSDKPGIRYTTDVQFTFEKQVCEMMAAGRDQVAPITPQITVEQIKTEFTRLTNGIAPNSEQAEAVRVALTSPDRVTGIVGAAGVGKTTALETIQSFAHESGYRVIGVASTSRAVEEMRKSGIQAVTLQSFLLANSPEAIERTQKSIAGQQSRIAEWTNRVDEKREQIGQTALQLAKARKAPYTARKPARIDRLNGKFKRLASQIPGLEKRQQEQQEKLAAFRGKQMARGMPLDNKPRYVLADESSLAATHQYHQLLRGVAARTGDRTLLVGDPGQHESIEAARVFDLLLQAGLRKGEIYQIVRQENPEIKAVVEQCQLGKHASALDMLQEQGRVKEMKRAERLQTIVSRYLQAPDSSIIINPDNKGRKEINAIVREHQKAQGVIERNGITGQILVPRQDLTGADREAALKYEVGNIVRFREGSKSLQIERGSHWKVSSRETEKNQVSLYREKPDGTVEQRTFNPKFLKHLEVYEREERELCVGDKILFKRQVKEHGIANGTAALVEKIEGRNVTAKLVKTGELVTWHAPENQLSKIPHIDYGHASTSYSFQGATTGRTFVHLDTAEKNAKRLITQALFYVAASRPKHELEVYTGDTARLRSLLSISQEKGMALSPEQRHQYVPDEWKQQYSSIYAPSKGQEMEIRAI
jgi:conjugative relaxase-like TrwC/TraI family protein